MQLDKTRIAIRERGFLEILDLSLHVMRAHAKPLAIAFSAVAIPLFLLNHWLIGWMVEQEYLSLISARARYFWTMMLLVYIESPLASVAATSYLGKAMFFERPTARRIAAEIWKVLRQLCFFQLGLRGVALAWLLVATFHEEADTASEFLFLPALAFYVAIVRSVRPYLGEIILLERNPLRSRDKTTITVGRRNSALHGPSYSVLFSYSIGSVLVAVMIVLTFTMTFNFIWGAILHDWNWGPVMVTVCVPVSMWIASAFFCVVRYLSYLDLRIRHEGWEVELQMRAEASRVTSQLT